MRHPDLNKESMLSSIKCLSCGVEWRSKAQYIKHLKLDSTASMNRRTTERQETKKPRQATQRRTDATLELGKLPPFKSKVSASYKDYAHEVCEVGSTLATLVLERFAKHCSGFGDTRLTVRFEHTRVGIQITLDLWYSSRRAGSSYQHQTYTMDDFGIRARSVELIAAEVSALFTTNTKL